MLDGQVVAEMLKPTSTGGVGPIPTVIPNPIEHQVAGLTGFRTLWVVFVTFVIASAVFTFLSWRVPIGRRLFFIITTLITTIAAISYFAMATGDGVRLVCAHHRDAHKHVPDYHRVICRQVFWPRYVDWVLTTPLLILDLALLAGIDGGHTILAIVADVVMIATGLFAALGNPNTAQKWGWYTISCIAFLTVIWHVGVHGRAAVAARGGKVTKLFGGLSLLTLILWTAYPVAWAITEGTRKVSVDTEIIIYAVLDILAKVVFGAWLLGAHRRLPETNVEIGGYWTHGLSGEGRIRVGDEDDV